MKRTEIKNILMDFDGTLINSSEGIFWAFDQMFQEIGRESPAREELSWAIGPGAEEVFQRLFQNEGESVAMNNLKIFRKYYNSEGLKKTRLMEGAVEFLEEAKTKGFEVFLTTMKGNVATEKLVDFLSIRHLLSGVYANDPALKFGKKRDLVRHVLTSTGISPSTSVIIGDTLHDVESGKSLNLATVAVSFGYGDAHELSQAKPDFFANSFEELTTLLASGFSGVPVP